MKVTPSPRILSMLGEIEIAEWQCLAELIDNAADEIQRRNEVAPPAKDDLERVSCIEILLPKDRASRENAEVVVRDHGRGMTQSQLQQAVRAGWSGNDPFDRLGLFGMGFNISTARLGRVADILTTCSGENEWRGVRIDLDEIGEGFDVPEIREPKDDPSEHGTKIVIRRLDPDRLRFLSMKHEYIRRRLGHVYSWLLDHTAITIRINGKVVTPRRHCVWSEDRYVTYGRGARAETIPAVIPIDHELPEADACGDCGHWQKSGLGECDRCGGADMRHRRRRIHGWVGVQRYLHTDQYGIDFIRNGRKILMSDKSVFEWTDVNDPTGAVLVEYPIEIPANSGRIVGEIHLDHVPVDYKKDRFETSSREWIWAMELIRGKGPLRPGSAKNYGYDETNDSPVGRIFRGYQKNKPGTKFLIPGDGNSAINSEAWKWGTYFDRGDADYQTDQKWWEAAVYHDTVVEQKNQPATSDSGAADTAAVLAALGVAPTTTDRLDQRHDGDDAGDPTGTDVASGLTPPKPLSLAEHADLVRKDAQSIPALTREYRINAIGGRLDVRAWSVKPGSITEKTASGRSPLWLYAVGGGSADLFIDQKHPAFLHNGVEELDLVSSEVAHFLAVQHNWPNEARLSELSALLRADTFSDSNVDFPTVQDAARTLFQDIRERITESITENPERAWKLLTGSEIGAIEANLSALSAVPHSDDPLFIEYVPTMYLVRLFNEWPEAFTDSRVFVDSYDELTSDESKQMVKARISSLLLDCAFIATHEKEITIPNSLKRARLSTEILSQKLAA